MGNVNAVGPNECLVVSGGCCRNRQKYTVGGWSWSWWCVSSCDRISLRCLTLNPHCEGVETQKGVPLNVQGVAQVRVMYNKNHKNNKDKSKLLERACEHFLGMSAHEIRQVLQATLEGHLRSILGQMTVEEIFQDRERFADQVQDTARAGAGGYQKYQPGYQKKILARSAKKIGLVKTRLPNFCPEGKNSGQGSKKMEIF